MSEQGVATQRKLAIDRDLQSSSDFEQQPTPERSAKVQLAGGHDGRGALVAITEPRLEID